MSTKSKNATPLTKAAKKPLEEVKKEEKKLAKVVRKVAPRAKDNIGSIKTYGTNQNNLNSTLAKFGPSENQAALIAWAHTVANPRTLNPHPVPVIAGPGASAAEGRMYQARFYGVASANSSGFVAIGANCDGWHADPTQLVPQPDNIYLSAGLLTYPVHFTTNTWAGGAVANPLCYPQASLSALVPTVGLQFLSLPQNFLPLTNKDTRFTLVSIELRARPVSVALETSGDLAAFSQRMLAEQTLPTLYAGAADNVYAEMLAVQPQALARNRQACANWPSNKWLSVCGVPNTYTCFGQWPMTAAAGAADVSTKVGFPSIEIIGAGLQNGQEVEFELVYNYAVYGIVTYQTSGAGTGSYSGVVSTDSANMVVQNGMQKHLVPQLSTEKVNNPAGLASVLKSEGMNGMAPSKSAGHTVKDIAGWVKAGADVYESVMGSSLMEDILAVAGSAVAAL